MLAINPSVQSPRAYDLANLTAAQLGTRLAAGANATLRANIKTALQDGGYRYNIHPAETTAGYVAADLLFGHEPFSTFRYMSAAQVASVIAGDLAEDVTLPLQAAIDDFPWLTWEDGKYKITESLTLTDRKMFRWRANAGAAVIVNMASAGKPSLVITDCQYWKIDGIVISGRSAFPNKGILITTAGGQTSCFWTLDNIGLEPAGNGIELVKVNTVLIRNAVYWPSGALGVGSTVVSGASGVRKHAIFSDASISGNYCNELQIESCNLIGVDADVAGHANIKLGDGGGGCQGVNIINNELEGAQSVIEINDAYNLWMVGNFCEGATLTLNSCRYGAAERNYNWEHINVNGCINFTFRDVIQGPVTSSCSVDVNCVNVIFDNAEFQNAPTVSSTSTIFRSWSVAGALQADRIGFAGIRERGRSVAMGEWAAPAYSAGDYTGTTGTWTVESGDVGTFRYTLLGKTMVLHFDIATSTTASNAIALNMKIPGGFTAFAKDMYFEYTWSADNGTTTNKGIGRVISGDTNITLYRDIAGTAFANVTNLMLVRGTVIIELA